MLKIIFDTKSFDYEICVKSITQSEKKTSLFLQYDLDDDNKKMLSNIAVNENKFCNNICSQKNIDFCTIRLINNQIGIYNSSDNNNIRTVYHNSQMSFKINKNLSIKINDKNINYDEFEKLTKYRTAKMKVNIIFYATLQKYGNNIKMNINARINEIEILSFTNDMLDNLQLNKQLFNNNNRLSVCKYPVSRKKTALRILNILKENII